MGGQRDGFSSFKFFEVIAPQSFTGDAALTGATVDKQGYETLTFIYGAGEISGEASAQQSGDSCGWLRMQHGTSNAAGTVVWANCDAGDILTDLRREGDTITTEGMTSASYAGLAVSNAGSGIDNGTFFAIGGMSIENQSVWESKTFAAGYIGINRWVRVVASVSDAGDMSCVAIHVNAILGLEADWPVNTIRVTG